MQTQSIYGIARTLFLACLLAAGAMLIHSDTYRLVLQPVQRMVERVREMAEDPLLQAAVRVAPLAASSVAATAATKPLCNLQQTRPDDMTCMPDSHDHSGANGNSADTRATVKHSQSFMSTPTGVQRPSRTRVWPAVRVHAVAEETCDGLGACGSATSSPHASASKAYGTRTSGGAAQLTAGARRLSISVVAGMSAAGAAAARLGHQLLRRVSALAHSAAGNESDSDCNASAGAGEDGSSGRYETALLEQSIYKICALLAVGFGDAGAEVIAENIRREGDLNPIVPGRRMVRKTSVRLVNVWQTCSARGVP
jgi:hypothetical protein